MVVKKESCSFEKNFQVKKQFLSCGCLVLVDYNEKGYITKTETLILCDDETDCINGDHYVEKREESVICPKCNEEITLIQGTCLCYSCCTVIARYVVTIDIAENSFLCRNLLCRGRVAVVKNHSPRCFHCGRGYERK